MTVFRYEIPVRYAECDSQGVVFNAHYVAYCDHAMDEFLRAAVGDDSDFELMVKSASLTWHAPLRYREVATIGCSVTRWGTTSMDVQFVGFVADEARFDATLTYVAVTNDESGTVPRVIPSTVREAFASVMG